MMAGTMTEGSTVGAAPDKAAMRAALEGTKAEFRKIIESMSDEDLARKTTNPAWTCGEMAFHVASSPRYVGGSAASMLGRGSASPALLLPRFVLDFLSPIAVRRGAKRATRESLLSDYEAGIDTLLAHLDAAGDGDWGKTAKFGGEERTLAQVFGLSEEHLAEHGPQIRSALGK